jgi:hypothetical protein
MREGPEGFSIATNTWFVVVSGAVKNGVPNVYPVSSYSTLIFMILRDPPGGGSSVSIAKGTQASLH